MAYSGNSRVARSPETSRREIWDTRAWAGRIPAFQEPDQEAAQGYQFDWNLLLSPIPACLWPSTWRATTMAVTGRRPVSPRIRGGNPAPVEPAPHVALGEGIARKAHEGHFRRDGVTPYITHPEALAKSLEGEDPNVIATAWLHDVLEDTTLTPDVLLDAGIPKEVVSAVSILTRTGEVYAEYLGWIRQHDIARKVKIMDIRHNLSDSPTDKQVEKYTDALRYLETPRWAVKDSDGNPATFTTTTETGRPRP